MGHELPHLVPWSLVWRASAWGRRSSCRGRALSRCGPMASSPAGRATPPPQNLPNLRPDENPAEQTRAPVAGSTAIILAGGHPRLENVRPRSHGPSDADARRRQAQTRPRWSAPGVGAGRAICPTKDGPRTPPGAHRVLRSADQDFRNDLRHSADPRKPNEHDDRRLAQAMTDQSKTRPKCFAE